MTLKKIGRFRILIAQLHVSIIFIFWGRGEHIFVRAQRSFCDFHHHLQCLIPIHVYNELDMGIVALKYHLPSIEKVIK